MAHRKRPIFAAALALAPFLAAAPPVAALDYRVHGFASGGCLTSSGNNLYGETDGRVACEYFEAGIGGSLSPVNRLLLSAQVVARDAGAADDGKPRLDYGFLDYAVLADQNASAGLRVGRVKNSFGFFNDTRDVVFTRPSVLLPSAYYETFGARGALFSSDGAQVYGGTGVGDHYLTLVAGFAPERELSNDEKGRLLGGVPESADARLGDQYAVRLQDEWDDGRWTAAISTVHTHLGIEDPSNPAADVLFHAELHLASLRYNTEKFGLTTEYAFTQSSTVTGAGDVEGDIQAIYIQGDHYLTPAWTLFLRYDGTTIGRGAACQPMPELDPCIANDYSVGLSWKSPAHWGVWAEFHRVTGAATVSAADNADRQVEDHWSSLSVVVGYRF